MEEAREAQVSSGLRYLVSGIWYGACGLRFYDDGGGDGDNDNDKDESADDGGDDGGFSPFDVLCDLFVSSSRRRSTFRIHKHTSLV